MLLPECRHLSVCFEVGLGLVFTVKPHHVFFSSLKTSCIFFQKFWELAKQVSEFMTWKKVECPFEKDRKILQYLLTAPAFTEDGRQRLFAAAPAGRHFHLFHKI